jgi:hypothetical protein
MLTRPQNASQASICHGDYYHSEDRLYRVEQTNGERVLVEDCASGELFDIPARDLRRLTPTRPQGSLSELSDETASELVDGRSCGESIGQNDERSWPCAGA